MTFKVELPHQGVRLDNFLKEVYPRYSRSKIQQEIKQKNVFIQNRSSVKNSSKLSLNDLVTIQIDNATIKKSSSIKTIYQDNSIIVISKPPFMAVHPAGSHVFDCVTVNIEETLGHKIYSVHRLDRETSGVLILAKNKLVATKITKQFEKAAVKKAYFFISKGVSKKSKFKIEARIGHPHEDLERIKGVTYDKKSTYGKAAVTDVIILKTTSKYSIGLAFPKTGRQHQIRIHLKSIGLPILGDKLYLKDDFSIFQRFKDNKENEEDLKLTEIPRQALHALALKIDYTPSTFIDEIPNDLKKILIKNKISITDLSKKINHSLKTRLSLNGKENPAKR